MEKKYTLTPEEVPEIQWTRTNIYNDIVDEFLKGHEKSVRVEVLGSNWRNIYYGLRYMLRKRDIKNIVLTSRGTRVQSSVYLQKVDEAKEN